MSVINERPVALFDPDSSVGGAQLPGNWKPFGGWTPATGQTPWEQQVLAAEPEPLRQFALKNDLAMIKHFDPQIFALEEELQRQAQKSAAREYALLQTVPGIGENLGMTILCEIGNITRFPTVKDFLSYCRLARLGGHLGRRGDGAPGPLSVARGLRRLHDITLGWQLARKKPKAKKCA